MSSIPETFSVFRDGMLGFDSLRFFEFYASYDGWIVI